MSIEPSSEPQSRVWFTESLNNANGELIVDPKTGNATLYVDNFPASVGGGAYGVYAGLNVVWYAGLSALVRWDRATQQYSIWRLPGHGLATGRFVTLDDYGEPWYTRGVADGESNDNFVGVLRGNGTVQEWRIPDVGSDLQQISIDPATQRPWVAAQSRAAGNGSIVNLDGSGGSIFSSVPTMMPSHGNPTIVTPVSSTVSASVQTITPTTTSISSSRLGPFTRYALGRSLPRDALIDSSGDVWVSEPGANKIVRLSLTTPDFALLAAPPLITIQQGQSASVTVSGASIAGYAGHVTLSMTIPVWLSSSNFSQNPLSITPGKTVLSKLVMNISPNASTGTGVLLIQGTDGNVTHRLTLFLRVTNATITGPSASQCLIATAAYGSDLSPEVQLLRNFRDNSVDKTRIGSSFLIIFNTWYYSFSPYVANYLHNDEFARAVTNEAFYPLIEFCLLSSNLFAQLSAYPELATMLSGLLLSVLIGAFYVGLPLGLVMRLRPYARKLPKNVPVILLLVSVTATVVGQAISSTLLLMAATPMTVLFGMWASATLTLRMLLRGT